MTPRTAPSTLPRLLGTALIALLLGLVIGNASTKADLRHAQEEIDKLKQERDKRGSSPASLGGISTMLNLPDKNQPAPHPYPSRHRHPADRTNQSHTAGAEAVVPPVATGAVAAAAATNPPPANPRRQIEQAVELWKTRCDLARNGFVSTVATGEEQAAQFDVIMAAMNLRLSNCISRYAASIREEDAMSPETGLRMLNELSSGMVLAYQDLDRTMPAGWRKQAGTKFSVLDFINPDSALPLADVQDKLHPPDPDPANAEAEVP